MEKQYYLGRKAEEMEMARNAVSPEARLVHLELATQYGARARTHPNPLALIGNQLGAADRHQVHGPVGPTAGDALADAKRRSAR